MCDWLWWTAGLKLEHVLVFLLRVTLQNGAYSTQIKKIKITKRFLSQKQLHTQNTYLLSNLFGKFRSLSAFHFQDIVNFVVAFRLYPWILPLIKGKSLNFCHYMYVSPVKPRSHKPSGAFLCVRDSLHTCIYFPFSRYFKIVTASLFTVGKMELSPKPNLCLWGAWKFPQRNRRAEKCREILPQKFNGPRFGRYPGVLLYVGHMGMYFWSSKE